MSRLVLARLGVCLIRHIAQHFAVGGWVIFCAAAGRWMRVFAIRRRKSCFATPLPALLFFSIYGNKVDFGSQIPLIAAGAVASLILFFGAEL